MKKLLFMMMIIASNLNAMNVNYWQRLEIEEQAEKRARSDVQTQIIPAKPTMSKENRENGKDTRVQSFVIGVQNIHLLAKSAKRICATSGGFLETRLYDPCCKMYDAAKFLLTKIGEITDIAVPSVSDTVRKRRENCIASNFLVDAWYFLAALWQIMNTISEPQIRQQLYRIEEVIRIILELRSN